MRRGVLLGGSIWWEVLSTSVPRTLRDCVMVSKRHLAKEKMEKKLFQNASTSREVFVGCPPFFLLPTLLNFFHLFFFLMHAHQVLLKYSPV